MTEEWKPDYEAEYARRAERLARIRSTPGMLDGLKEFYRDRPAEFIGDWGMTFDPRNPEIGLPAVVPFLLFPKQAEFLSWLRDRWLAREDGLVEKSRDMGLSWLCVGFSVWMILFHPGTVAGFGSRKEEYVDDLSDPKSLFWKARQFISLLPPEFRPDGWNPKTDAPFMTIKNRENGSAMVGEAGDNIGRGNRTSVYFKDESAFYEHASSIDAALSQTSNCKIDVSTPNGMGNPFHRKRFGGKIKVFTFHWRDDPRKGDAWYAKQCAELDPVTVAQEIDINYAASVDGVVIPSEWVQSAVDAHVKLGFDPTGARMGALDVADEGKDYNAFCGAHGVVVELVREWSGKGGDIFSTTQRAFGLCDEYRYEGFRFDADGLGAGVRGDARVISEARAASGQRFVRVDPFRGSEAPINPHGEDVRGRKNKDFFANRKSQGWWSLRLRFQRTHQAITEGRQFSPDELISIRSGAENRDRLTTELSQPTYSINTAGKIVIDKAPDGARSPNLADSLMIAMSPNAVSRGAHSFNAPGL